MLRRHVATASVVVGVAYNRPSIAVRGFFNPFGGANKAGDAKDDAAQSGKAGGFPGFPPGLDPQKLRTMQELFNSQSPEKQQELLKQAMDFQKTMSKVPGFGKFAEKNAAMMEQMMKLKDQVPKTSDTTFGGTTAGNTSHNRRELFQAAPRASSSSSSSTTGGSGKTTSSNNNGPTLDDLRKVNLGPEIESLFQELRTMRSKKNEYRDKFFTANAALEQMQNELNELRTKEANVRQKLSKAEKDVMLLTSENMELRDSDKRAKALMQANKKLAVELKATQSKHSAGTAAGSPAYVAMQQQLKAKEEALRSLQRKVDRMRRRDPLLQFSLACSDVARFCDEAHDPAKDSAEESFSQVQCAYLQKQQSAWNDAAQQDGAAAKAFVAVARRYILSKVPRANLDALVTVRGDVKSAVAAFEALGFVVEATTEADRIAVCSRADAAPCAAAPGPYGYAFAWRVVDAAKVASSTTSSTEKESFLVEQAHPYVSAALLSNTSRCATVFETARASGPGGQATNVSETQVYVKLAIDGQAAFTAEAQDSRSALQNKENAVEKLHGERRQSYNDSLAKQRVEDVVASLVSDIQGHAGGALQIQEEVQQGVQRAAAAQQIPQGDLALVTFLEVLSRKVSATA